MKKQKRIRLVDYMPENVGTTRDRASEETPLEQLEDGLQIDQHDLDTALVQQPDWFYRVSKKLTYLVSQRDAVKQSLAEEEARCDAQFRSDAKNEKDKTTETEIKNMIRLDKEVRKISDHLLTLNRQVGEMTALKEAFQQRSYVLKDLVNLYVANYYTSNQDGGPSSRALKDHASDQARRGMAEARRRRNERD